MARTRKALPAQVDVAHLISAGALAGVWPRRLIEEVLAQTGKAIQCEHLLAAQAGADAGMRTLPVSSSPASIGPSGSAPRVPM